MKITLHLTLAVAVLPAVAASAQEFAIEPADFLSVAGTSTDGHFAVSGAALAAGNRPMSGGDFVITGDWRSVVPARVMTPRELIVNGSFEDTAGTFSRDVSGVMSLPTGSSAIPGWTTTTAELVWVNDTNTFGASTPFGTHSLDLTGYHDGVPYGGLAQTISTTPGQTYRLSLALGSNADYVGAGFPKSVFVCAGSTGTVLTLFPTNTTGQYWETFSFDFTADSTSTVIGIEGGRLSGSYLGVDNISVLADESSPASASTNLVLNGSFESFACPAGFAPDGSGLMPLPPGSTSIVGWTTTTAELAWVLNVNTFGPRTHEGSLFLDLTGYHDAPPYGGITQTLATTPNQSYRLSFSIGSHEGSSNYRGPMTVGVVVGPTSNSFTFVGSGLVNQWGRFTMDFTAESAATPLTFTGIATAGGAYLGLDDISVVPSETPGLELKIGTIEVNGGNFEFTVPTQPGRTYAIESRANLESGAWGSVPGTETPGTGQPVKMTIGNPFTEAQRFYRVRAQ